MATSRQLCRVDGEGHGDICVAEHGLYKTPESKTCDSTSVTKVTPKNGAERVSIMRLSYTVESSVSVQAES